VFIMHGSVSNSFRHSARSFVLRVWPAYGAAVYTDDLVLI